MCPEIIYHQDFERYATKQMARCQTKTKQEEQLICLG